MIKYSKNDTTDKNHIQFNKIFVLELFPLRFGYLEFRRNLIPFQAVDFQDFQFEK